MAIPPSLFFGIYKRVAVLGHVPEGTYHAKGTGGLSLANPSAIFGTVQGVPFIGSTSNPADSVMWAVLNARATSSGPVVIAGEAWQPMPKGSNPPGWADFQVNASPKLVDVIGEWIKAGKVNDIPAGIVSKLPVDSKGDVEGTQLFVAASPTDDGSKPVPADFWAQSQIFLTDPVGGAVNSPSGLVPGERYNVASVLGNRGRSDAGRFAAKPSAKVLSDAHVLVFNTSAGPAVSLPALSSLAPSPASPQHESFWVFAGGRDVAGWHLDVADVLDRLVAAVAGANMDTGGLSPEEWVLGQGAHICIRVRVTDTGSWPALGASPLQDRRIAQKNVAGFRLPAKPLSGRVRPQWFNFTAGPDAAGDGAVQRLMVRSSGRRPPLLLLNVPLRLHERILDRWGSAGFVGWSRDVRARGPMPEGVVYRRLSNRNLVVLPDLASDEFAALSLGVVALEDTTGRVRVSQSSQSKEQGAVVGGFSLAPGPRPRRRR